MFRDVLRDLCDELALEFRQHQPRTPVIGTAGLTRGTENDVAELEIAGTHEEQAAIMREAVKQLHSTIYGNGQPGILDFISGLRGQLRLLVVLVSIVSLIVAVLALLEGNRQAREGKLFSNSSDPVYTAQR